MSPHPAVARYAAHVSPAFVKLLGAPGHGRVFVRARGTRLWDDEGREYLDFFGGSGTTSLGHNHPRLRDALRDFLLEDAPSLVHVGPAVHAADLAAALAARAAPLTRCIFSSSGAEAVEMGLQIARAVTRRAGVVYCAGSDHGLTLDALAVTGHDRGAPCGTSGRGPLLGLIASRSALRRPARLLERALSRRVGAFVVEPILGEGGAVLPPPGYQADAQELCRRSGALLVLDEVQTGLGRTGTLFAHAAEGFSPDVLVLGKALGGSLAAIAATLTTPALHDRAAGAPERFDRHGSTCAGNAFACHAALTTLRIVDDDGLSAASAARGDRLLGGLRDALAGHPLVRDVRGRGLLVGHRSSGPTDHAVLERLAPKMIGQLSRRVFGRSGSPGSGCWRRASSPSRPASGGDVLKHRRPRSPHSDARGRPPLVGGWWLGSSGSTRISRRCSARWPAGWRRSLRRDERDAVDERQAYQLGGRREVPADG